jgi:tripartite-type tricarboxylate transporter receptor subunit TctC
VLRRLVLRKLAAFVAGLAAAGAISNAAPAADYPARPVTIVVAFTPGGPSDVLSRIIGKRLQEILHQPFIVENRPGAGGNIAAEQVKNAAPDGYTLLMGSIGTFGSQPLLYKLDYDPHKALAPVATVAIDKIVLVVGPSLQVKTVAELVEHAKANPGKLNYGNSIGIGPQLVAELFKVKSGTNIAHIPYRGGAPMISDLLAGQIDMTVNGKSVLLPHIQAGKVRALAVTGAERWPELPDVPTLVELGYLDAPYDALFGVMTPMGTPAAAIDKLNATINEGLRSPEMRASFAKIGTEPVVTTPQEFAALIASEVPKWAEVVRVIGVKAAQ